MERRMSKDQGKKKRLKSKWIRKMRRKIKNGKMKKMRLIERKQSTTITSTSKVLSSMDNLQN